jgi:phosphoribosyl 1,2-cyclic phosphate phosphodiesterase
MDALGDRFAYAFLGRDGYPPTVERHLLGHDMMIGDIRVRSTMQPHGTIYSAGLRFDHEGKSIGYSTDFHIVTQDMLDLFAGVDIWVVDALREKVHPTHPHLAMTLEAIATCKPGRAILTHMDQSMDYATLAAKLPAGVEPGQDGLTTDL